MISEDDIFVEQAEYLQEEEFLSWAIEHPEEAIILKKMSQGGAKVISGPRGSGKTTLFRKAFFKMLEPDSKIFPVYVNFKSSLKLEPFYKKEANAAFLFNQWMLLKIYQGIFETLEKTHPELKRIGFLGQIEVVRVIGNLEINQIELDDSRAHKVTISDLEEHLKDFLDAYGYSRCVLLLDDAAHAFSTEQQRDFFTLFRNLKSKTIAPKAAIYPGVTTFSADFHIGHDAEEINIWLDPESPKYLSFMIDVLEKRLPAPLFERLKEKQELLELLVFGSFGLPRSLLNMVRGLYSEKNGKLDIEITNKRVFDEIKTCFEITFSVYSSLEKKLPIFSNFVTAGKSMYEGLIAIVKAYNSERPKTRQSLKIALVRPVNSEIGRVLGFFQYAGLLMPKGVINRGNKGVYELYEIHYSALIERNAVLAENVKSAVNILKAIKSRPAGHLYPRVTPEKLFPVGKMDEVFSLSLPPCQVCKQPRISENAKFCSSCGAQLKTISIFESLVNQEISVLPLTSRRVKSIKENSNIKFVKDILIDYGHAQLRSVPQVGPYWSKKIYNYAEEYIS